MQLYVLLMESGWWDDFVGIYLQINVDEAVEKLKARGIEVYGLVCHVSNLQQRKNLIDKTIQVKYNLRNDFLVVDWYNGNAHLFFLCCL